MARLRALERPKDLDARGDVYQLSAVAYFLLTGEPPFKGDDLVEVLAKHLKHDPIAPSRALGRPIAPDLERLVLRCLEKDPNARYRDAGELRAALEACDIPKAWTHRDARLWWESWSDAHPDEMTGDSSSGSSGTPSGWSIDLGSRLRRSG
jgi:serine/threonine-protein kinase